MQTVKISALVFGFALVTAACGDSKSSLLPTAPSAMSADGAQASIAGDEYGTTANGPKPGNGNGNSNGGGNGNGNGNGKRPATTSPADPASPLAPGKQRVQIEGLIDAVDDGSITVRNQLVAVTAATVIRHGNQPFELSQLNPGDRVHVTASRVEATGNRAFAVAALEAVEIKLQNPGDGDDSDDSADAVALTALVSVSELDATATETGPNNAGAFRLARTVGDPSQLTTPLTVNFTLTGTAVNGTDYSLPLQATFAAGEPTVDVTLTPTNDGVAEPMETVTLTLAGVAPYELGSPVSATIEVTDAPPALISVVTTDAVMNEFGNFGVFTLTRTGGDLSAPLSVTVMFDGTATNGVDYSAVTSSYQAIGTTVNFAAGSASSIVLLLSKWDSVADPSETVTITVVDGDGYDPDVVASATLTITGS